MHYSERMRSVSERIRRVLILEWLPCTTVREWGESGWSWSGCHALQWENEERLADLGVVAMHYSERNEELSGWSWSVWLILEWLPCTTVREWGESGWSWSGCHALQWENEERLVDLGVVAMHYSERMRRVWLILEWLPCTTVREWGESGWSWSGCHALQWENEESLADLGVVAMHYSERMRRVWLILEWLPCTTVREWGVSGWSWNVCLGVVAMHYSERMRRVWLILEWLPCTTVREWGVSGWSWSGCHALQWENEERLADLGVVAMHYSERMRRVWLILEWLPCTTVREWGESGWSWSGCHALQWENEESGWSWSGCHALWENEGVWLILEWLPCTTVREWGASGWSWSGCHALQWENEELWMVAMILEWLPCTTVREWGESGWSWSGCHAL